MTYAQLTAGVSEASIQAIIRSPDQRSYWGLFKVKASSIDGLGVFTVIPMRAGDQLGPARIDGRRTPIGRYTNHSDHPNAEMRLVGRDLVLILSKNVEKNREITVDYAQVLRVNRENPWI